MIAASFIKDAKLYMKELKADDKKRQNSNKENRTFCCKFNLQQEVLFLAVGESYLANPHAGIVKRVICATDIYSFV